MGIEHRMKDETDDNYWKCPHCGVVEELQGCKASQFDMGMPKDNAIECSECGDKSEPHDNMATWEDFWVYCQSLKHL
jgi:DNA-directed RNA polymerase subunit RPC12/RpoP